MEIEYIDPRMSAVGVIFFICAYILQSIPLVLAQPAHGKLPNLHYGLEHDWCFEEQHNRSGAGTLSGESAGRVSCWKCGKRDAA